MMLFGYIKNLALCILQHSSGSYSIVKSAGYDLVGGLYKRTPYAVILDNLGIVFHIGCGGDL